MEFEPGPEEEAPPPPKPPLERLAEHWQLALAIGGPVLSPVLYLLLAEVAPAAALFISSLCMIVGIIFIAQVIWPAAPKITWARRLEVWGYRIAIGLAVYLVIGVGVAFLVNTLTARTIPLSWPEAVRFIPFWPFYLYLVVGCDLFGPCPPPPG